ncbi:hypothetical protein HPB48_011292 [Haemaphysalis longicornis]|uniref:Uncharacterized protein n=1 Tax=Haemaphysalis longicornis TaxID=44386 RepID=A0A9J6GP75_HAELO|nr:hypothetical protein HPB48_011292 [Haemaphysalis longicornis]
MNTAGGKQRKARLTRIKEGEVLPLGGPVGCPQGCVVHRASSSSEAVTTELRVTGASNGERFFSYSGGDSGSHDGEQRWPRPDAAQGSFRCRNHDARYASPSLGGDPNQDGESSHRRRDPQQAHLHAARCASHSLRDAPPGGISVLVSDHYRHAAGPPCVVLSTITRGDPAGSCLLPDHDGERLVEGFARSASVRGGRMSREGLLGDRSDIGYPLSWQLAAVRVGYVCPSSDVVAHLLRVPLRLVVIHEEVHQHEGATKDGHFQDGDDHVLALAVDEHQRKVDLHLEHRLYVSARGRR